MKGESAGAYVDEIFLLAGRRLVRAKRTLSIGFQIDPPTFLSRLEVHQNDGR